MNMKSKQIRATIAPHLHDRFLLVGKQIGTDDPTTVLTHILNCCLAGVPVVLSPTSSKISTSSDLDSSPSEGYP